jgi:2-polyprenyl-3-methyl-5-hydroxy-6-metoxy-1,4-benzoquinol methylase
VFRSNPDKGPSGSADAIMEQFESIENCPVCGSAETVFFRKATLDPDSLNPDSVKITDRDYGKTWELWRCQSCTHTFANPVPTKDYIGGLYQRIEDPLYEEEAEGRAKNFLPILRYLEKLRPSRGRLFDVGAATGILLNLARDRGWRPAGIETSRWSVRTAEQKYGLSIETGDFAEADLPEEAFDAVTMIDFIEHVPDPLPALDKARSILAPEGILCIVTPDLKSLAARAAGKKWWHFRPAHLAYFNRRSLTRLCRRAGFQLVRSRRYAWTFSAHYLLSRLPVTEHLLKIPFLASFSRRIPIKLALKDSLEFYLKKINP